MSSKGVHFKKNEPVERLATEGALDQVLGISIDDSQKDVVFLDSVADENDLFRRCPVIGEIDYNLEIDGQSLKTLLAENPKLVRHICMKTPETALSRLEEGAISDAFSITDARWLNDPRQLIWRSLLLAQLLAKRNAICHFLNDPSIADFSKSLCDEDRQGIAARARQLADALQDAAMNEINGANDFAKEQYHTIVEKTRQRFMRYTVGAEDSIRNGGLTKTEVDELFEEV